MWTFSQFYNDLEMMLKCNSIEFIMSDINLVSNTYISVLWTLKIQANNVKITAKILTNHASQLATTTLKQ